jgi:hypothetical protein
MNLIIEALFIGIYTPLFNIFLQKISIYFLNNRCNL